MIKWQEWTVVHVSMFVTFILSALMCNIVNIAVYLVVRPVDLDLYRRIASFLNWTINAQLMVLGTHYSGSELTMHADPEVVKEIGNHHGIFLMNHHYEVDWLFSWVVADAYGCLANGKVIAKKMLKYVPTIGVSWALNDMVFVDRDWEKDKETLTKSMDVLASHKQPFWLLLFPEGTRLSKEKLEKSREFSLSRNLPVFEHQLYPRTKGFARIMEKLDRSRVKYVYDITIMFDTKRGAWPNITNLLMGRKMLVDCYVRRYSTADISSDPEEASKFLVNVCLEKDALMESYKKSDMLSFTSHLPTEEKAAAEKWRQIQNGGEKKTFREIFPAHEPFVVRKRWLPFVSSLVLNLVMTVPIVGKLGAMAASGSMAQLAAATLIVAGSFFVLKKFIGLTKMDPVETKQESTSPAATHKIKTK